MAGVNLPAKKYAKSSPTQLRLSFEFTGNGTKFIDIAKALSIINRKFYRQGVYYYVNSVEFYNAGEGHVDLHTIPDNWVTKNAWNRGFSLFQKMNSLVDSPMTNVGRPKYHDFKVYMSVLHMQNGSTSPSLHGINSTIATDGLASDDWEYSQFVSADDDADATQEADNFYVHMIGGHNGTPDNWQSVGLIKSYSESRGRVMSSPEFESTGSLPDTDAATDPLLNVFDFSSEEQMNDIIERLDLDNDNPPYDSDYYIGAGNNHMQQQARLVTTSSIGRVTSAPGFCAPFGLICVDPDNLQFGSEDNFRIVLNIAAGTYHGVYAERA